MVSVLEGGCRRSKVAVGLAVTFEQASFRFLAVVFENFVSVFSGSHFWACDLRLYEVR
jgi:hypothetical protein